MTSIDLHHNFQPLPVVFKRTAAWQNIQLAHYRLGQGIIPEHQHNKHLVIISLGHCKGELRTGNGLLLPDCAPNNVCVIPSGHPFQGRVDDESEFISLFIDPDLVASAAAAENLPGLPEIVERSAASDPLLSNVGLALLTEVGSKGLSGPLYAESLANILAIHLLRHYSEPHPGFRFFSGGLTDINSVKLRTLLKKITSANSHSPKCRAPPASVRFTSRASSISYRLSAASVSDQGPH